MLTEKLWSKFLFKNYDTILVHVESPPQASQTSILLQNSRGNPSGHLETTKYQPIN